MKIKPCVVHTVEINTVNYKLKQTAIANSKIIFLRNLISMHTNNSNIHYTYFKTFHHHSN